MPKVRLRTIGAATVVLTVLSGCSGNPQQTPAPSAAPRSGSVWVADEGHDSITVINAATNAVAMTLNGIKGPHNIQVGRDGAVVYAVSSAGVVVAIDPTTYQVSATAPTGAQPAHVIEAPNGKVYVTNSGDGTVSVYQTPGLSPAGLIRLDGMPHGLRAAAGGSVIVVANTMDGALDLINPTTDIDGVQPFRLMIGLARLLAVVTRPPTDALLGCLPFDLSHRQQAGRFKKSPVGRT